MRSLMLACIAMVLLWPAGLRAQEVPEEPAEAMEQAQTAPVLEREMYSYAGQGRRDPFKELEAGAELGPRFEDLELSGIIYSPDAGSVVVLVDRSTQRRYRVWEGDVVGGAQLLAVTPDQAVFMVTVFGVSRQETLRLKNSDKE
ncbi:MAG: hypothetical protein M8866_00115 [marine benthic group bacterium]|nr:hypothetical protein [Candidatus Benthicola marisminoris]